MKYHFMENILKDMEDDKLSIQGAIDERTHEIKEVYRKAELYDELTGFLKEVTSAIKDIKDESGDNSNIEEIVIKLGSEKKVKFKENKKG